MVLMKYLLDTNIISELVKNEPNQAVLLKLDQYQHEVVTAAPYGTSFNTVVDVFLNPVNEKLLNHFSTKC